DGGRASNIRIAAATAVSAAVAGSKTKARSFRAPSPLMSDPAIGVNGTPEVSRAMASSSKARVIATETVPTKAWRRSRVLVPQSSTLGSPAVVGDAKPRDAGRGDDRTERHVHRPPRLVGERELWRRGEVAVAQAVLVDAAGVAALDRDPVVGAEPPHQRQRCAAGAGRAVTPLERRHVRSGSTRHRVARVGAGGRNGRRVLQVEGPVRPGSGGAYAHDLLLGARQSGRPQGGRVEADGGEAVEVPRAAAKEGGGVPTAAVQRPGEPDARRDMRLGR